MSQTLPVTSRRAQTQARLLEAAEAVFAERGIAAASVEEICEQAGFSRGAFYSNFSSKDELCVALLSSYSQRDASAVEETVRTLGPLGPEQPFDEVLERAIDIFVDLQRGDETWILVNAELRLHAARTPAVREAYATFCEGLFTPMVTILEGALAQVGHRLVLPVDEALELLRSVWEDSLLSSLLFRDRPRSLPDVRRTLVALLRALTAPVS